MREDLNHEKVWYDFLTIILFKRPIAVGWPVTHRVTKCLLSCLLIKMPQNELLQGNLFWSSEIVTTVLSQNMHSEKQ